jgi:DNA (cytosine-5)-methyltransferase 1
VEGGATRDFRTAALRTCPLLNRRGERCHLRQGVEIFSEQIIGSQVATPVKSRLLTKGAPKLRRRNLPVLGCLSAFTGLGGLDLGLETAGFQVLGYIEIDPTARQSLKKNRPGWVPLDPFDVGKASGRLKPRDLGLRRGELAVLAGAPPCQPFSKAAQWSNRGMRGILDPRAACLSGFLRLAETFLPRVILMENVEGFATGRTSALSLIERHLDRINRRNNVRYRLQAWVVDAADYGVPQHRRRAILFAARSGQKLDLPRPTHSKLRITAWDALSGLRQAEQKATRGRGWLGLLPSIPEGSNYQWHTRRGGGDPLFGYRTKYWSFLLKLAKHRPSWTLSAQPGPYTGPFHWTSRPLSQREMLRLQTFPSTWHVLGTTREQVRQIGNATPPLLAEVIGRAVRSQIFGYADPGKCRLMVRRSRVSCPPPEPLSRVPRKFRNLRGAWPDHPGTGRGPSPVSTQR